MNIQVTFRHFNGQHPNLHQDAETLAASFAKYYDGITSTSVEFINDIEKTVIFVVHLQGGVLSSTDASDDFHKSLNASAEKMIKQIQKHKEKKTESRKVDPKITQIEDYDE